MMKNNITGTLLSIILSSLLWGCGSAGDAKKPHTQHYKVTSKSNHKTIFFTGTIQPIGQNAITSSMEAVIETMHYHYGQLVKKGAIVVTLNSNELQRQYNDTLTDYLKAKDNFSVTNAKFIGTKDLWDAGLLSKNNFLSEKSSLDTARVTLMQSTRKLTEMLEKMDEKRQEDLSKLTIAKFEKVRQALTGKHSAIHLRAPTDGVLLYPPKLGDGKSDHNGVGSTLKAGQVYGLVGDLSGISVEIDIPEIDILQVHPGMKANITGIALAGQTLQGELVTVNAQASSNVGNGLPSFSALVEVKQLTKTQRALIKVGMSASIELVSEDKEQLQIPIAAIKQDQGQRIVMLLGADGKPHRRVITTGVADVDSVKVISGLHVGDTVVYDQ